MYIFKKNTFVSYNSYELTLLKRCLFINRIFREDCLTFEMSSGSAGKDSESGSHFQPGLRRPLLSTQEKLQNGLGMVSKFRIFSVFLFKFQYNLLFMA